MDINHGGSIFHVLLELWRVTTDQEKRFYNSNLFSQPMLCLQWKIAKSVCTSVMLWDLRQTRKKLLILAPRFSGFLVVPLLPPCSWHRVHGVSQALQQAEYLKDWDGWGTGYTVDAEWIHFPVRRNVLITNYALYITRNGNRFKRKTCACHKAWSALSKKLSLATSPRTFETVFEMLKHAKLTHGDLLHLLRSSNK